MIKGIGTDIIRPSRLRKSLDRFGDKFAARVLAQGEFEQFQRVAHPEKLLAKRFAVKEAASKALGTGIGEGVSWHDIFVDHDDLGAPQLRMVGRAAALAEKKGITAMHVSISDEGDYALAFVVLSG